MHVYDAGHDLRLFPFGSKVILSHSVHKFLLVYTRGMLLIVEEEGSCEASARLITMTDCK